MSTCGVCLEEFDPTIQEHQWRGHDSCTSTEEVDGMQELINADVESALQQQEEDYEHDIKELKDEMAGLIDANQQLHKQLEGT